MDQSKFFYGFQFHNHSIVYKKVNPKTFIELHSIEHKADRLLALDLETAPIKSLGKHAFIDRLQ